MMSGTGIFYFGSGGYVKGNFYKGKVNGLGNLHYPNGDYYVGFWKNGSFNTVGLTYH